MVFPTRLEIPDLSAPIVGGGRLFGVCDRERNPATRDCTAGEIVRLTSAAWQQNLAEDI
jgi:hypothetical protein